MSGIAQQQSRIKDLIIRGREQGYLTYADVNDHLPQDISDPDQVEDIIQMINDMGISVFESAPDAEDLLNTADITTDDVAVAEAAAALAAAPRWRPPMPSAATNSPCSTSMWYASSFSSRFCPTWVAPAAISL